ncbi:MAG: N-succinylarginine dihydrolase [Cellvibrionaceae bacterium]
MSFIEANFDGLIGPTHNYSGLSFGNLASHKNAKLASNPKAAALQGLDKMQLLINKGYTQGFLLSQLRPKTDFLRLVGFSGTDHEIINKVAKQKPELLTLVYSASSMWAANAATVTPSPDSGDGRLHFTPANLHTTAHRAIEHEETYRCLKTIFNDSNHFEVHRVLPGQSRFADEGAANHSRLCNSYGDSGIGMFVYGRKNNSSIGASPNSTYPARQALEASEAVARQHQLPSAQQLFTQQSQIAIDAGAFHNDVVAVANGPVLFHHECAFTPEAEKAAYDFLQIAVDFKPIKVLDKDVSLKDAISSYLFNSQLLASPDGSMDEMTLIAPIECEENPAVNIYLEKLLADDSQPIRHVNFVDVRQSMSNGGGPACLRLRVVLNEEQFNAANQTFILNTEKIDALKGWVNDCYRDRLLPSDLADPEFMDETAATMNKLSDLLALDNYYQR